MERPTPRTLTRDPLVWVCAPLLLAAAVVVSLELGRQPFWVDESIAVLPAESVHEHFAPVQPFDQDFMPWQLKHDLWDPATPLYRYAVGIFTAFFGFTETTTRAFSVLMGLLSAVPFFLLVRRLYDARTAFLATTFLLTSTTFMVFAREARHFTFVMCTSLWTLYYLHRAASDPDDLRARGRWFVFLCATLLSQTLGYGILPIVAIYVLLNGPLNFVHVSQWRSYLVAGGIYAAFFVAFWDTLPFFHVTSCENRPAGCEDSYLYYLDILYGFLSPMTERFEWDFVKLWSPLPFLAGAGLAIALADAALRRGPRSRTSFVLVWFFVPLLLLSVRDVKFPRYIWMWVMPLCALFPAIAIAALSRWRTLGTAAMPLAAALCVVVAAAPQLPFRDPALPLQESGVRSATLFYLHRHVLGAPADNWERIRWQTEYLEERLGPRDVVVNSFDDASLGWYLDRPVYGMLASRHSDASLVAMLDRAERDGWKVWFVDTLPNHNYCLSDDPEPRSIDCREKFPEFYRRCLTVTACGETEPACVHVPID